MTAPEFISFLIRRLRDHPAVNDKINIHRAYAPAQAVAGGIPVGDDCAAIPDGDGFLLLAAEGMLDNFVAADPWFAGYSAVMVNLSDIAAMGGRPLAVVDVLWTPGEAFAGPVWEGMSAASQAYGVPIVGGHTTQITNPENSTHLAAAVLGRAGSRLISSFDARAGDEILMAVDLKGAYRSGKPFWNASSDAPPEQLRKNLAILPAIAEAGWCRAGKDISNGGIVGTLAMLLHCSGVGAEILMDFIPRPNEADASPEDFFRWLIAFPSYGYLLSVAPEHVAAVRAIFLSHEISCASIGKITAEKGLVLGFGAVREAFLTE